MDIETSQRRASTRRPGLWHGRYRSGRLRRWTACRVLDVSMGGAAIEVDPDADVPAARVVLELRPVGSALDPVGVDAEVRHARRLETGAWHVGLRFGDLTPTQRDALDKMLRLFAT